MKINMDGLRRNIVDALATLTNKLNRAVDEEGMIVIDPDDIRQDMNELQSFVGGLCCIFEPGDEMFTDMSDYSYNNLPDFVPIEDNEDC